MSDRGYLSIYNFSALFKSLRLRAFLCWSTEIPWTQSYHYNQDKWTYRRACTHTYTKHKVSWCTFHCNASSKTHIHLQSLNWPRLRRDKIWILKLPEWVMAVRCNRWFPSKTTCQWLKFGWCDYMLLIVVDRCFAVPEVWQALERLVVCNDRNFRRLNGAHGWQSI